MRLVELDKHIETRKKVSFYSGITWGVIVAVVVFILMLAGGFLAALLVGFFSGGFIFALIYFLRELTHKGVERKRNKLQINNPTIDVLFNGEIGLLEFQEDKLIYHNLTPGGAQKTFESMINENLYMSVGLIQYRKLQKYTHKDIESGFILVKSMPHGRPMQFIFYNTDNVLDKVNEIIESLNKYVHVE